MSSAIFTRRGPNRPKSPFGKLAWRGRSDGPDGATSFLPLQGSRSEGNEVIVPVTRTQVTHTPHTEEANRLSPEQGAALYDYYGISDTDRPTTEARLDGA